MAEVTKDTRVCNAEPQGQYAPNRVSKFHLDRGDTTAMCSQRVFLNVDLPRSYGNGYARLGDLPRESVCRKCVPVMP